MRDSITRLRPVLHQHKNLYLRAYTIVVLCLCMGGCAGRLIDSHFKGMIDKPQGNITLPGLKDKVTVCRDAYGIPFLEAKNMEDMAMAVGYVHASDRLTQMMGLKLVSEGRLAEMAGPAVVDLDIYMRAMNIRRAAEDLYKNITPENRALLERYCDGINTISFSIKTNCRQVSPWQAIHLSSGSPSIPS